MFNVVAPEKRNHYRDRPGMEVIPCRQSCRWSSLGAICRAALTQVEPGPLNSVATPLSDVLPWCLATASSIDGAAEVVTLAAGDFVVLPHGYPFRIASDSQATAVDIMAIIDGPLNGRILTWQGGGSCLAMSALFTFEGHHTAVLLKALPSVLHIREPADRAAMRW